MSLSRPSTRRDAETAELKKHRDAQRHEDPPPWTSMFKVKEGLTTMEEAIATVPADY